MTIRNTTATAQLGVNLMQATTLATTTAASGAGEAVRLAELAQLAVGKQA